MTVEYDNTLNEELPKRWRRPNARKGRRKRRVRGTQSYPCPKCEANTRVTRTKRVDGGTTRERTCKKCRHEFVTIETAKAPEKTNASEHVKDLQKPTSGKRVNVTQKTTTRKRVNTPEKTKSRKRASKKKKSQVRKRATVHEKPNSVQRARR